MRGEEIRRRMYKHIGTPRIPDKRGGPNEQYYKNDIIFDHMLEVSDISETVGSVVGKVCACILNVAEDGFRVSDPG